MEETIRAQLVFKRWLRDNYLGGALPEELALLQDPKWWRGAHQNIRSLGAWNELQHTVGAWKTIVKETAEALKDSLARAEDGGEGLAPLLSPRAAQTLKILGLGEEDFSSSEKFKSAAAHVGNCQYFLKHRQEEIETNINLLNFGSAQMEAYFWSPAPTFWAEESSPTNCLLTVDRNGLPTVRRWPTQPDQIQGMMTRVFLEQCGIEGAFPSIAACCPPNYGLLMDASFDWRTDGEVQRIADAYSENKIVRPPNVTFLLQAHGVIQTIEGITFENCRKGMTLMELVAAVKTAWNSDPEADWRLRVLTEKSLAAIAAAISGTPQ